VNLLEAGMYEIAKVFLFPVLLLILAMFAYACTALGAFLVEVWQRRSPQRRRSVCPLHRDVLAGVPVDPEALELRILEILEPLRVTTRTAPMLGLVATMIPLAPALLALGDGDLTAVGQNLVVAFAAVILALLTASMTFLVVSVRRRWLVAALYDIEKQAGISK
jgi:hypothetical protein